MNSNTKLVCALVFLCACSSDLFAQGPCGGKPCAGERTNAPASPKNPSRDSKITKPPPARPKIPRLASLMVNSNLPNVTVTLNGRAAGITDSSGYLAIGMVKPGTYTVAVAKAGYHPNESVVQLSESQSETVEFALKPITQALTISSTPAECEIFVDEVPHGSTDASGRATLTEVPVGEHRITIRKPRYREAIIPLSLSADKEGQISANLEWAIGFLTVTTNAPNPSIDVSALGRLANPVSKFECQPGTYTVTISSPLYLTSRREVQVTAGQETPLSIELEADTKARNQLISEALGAYSHKQYDRAVTLAQVLLSADPKQPEALTVLAESYFMKDDFNSFSRYARQAIEAGGTLEISLRHHHEFFASSSMHPVRLVLTAQTLSYDPQPAPNLPCSNSAFTVSLAVLGSAEVSGNRDNEIYLRLVFVDPKNPKKTTTLRFGDRESYFVKVRKSTAGGLVGYVGETMVSRRQAYGAISVIARVLNKAKTVAGESATAANRVPEVILAPEESGPAATFPTVESIISANISAVGGPAKWTTVIQRGTYVYTATDSGKSVSGTFEEYIKGTDKFMHMFYDEKLRIFFGEGSDGTRGWYSADKVKPHLMQRSALESAKRNVVMFSLTDPKDFQKIFPITKMNGRAKLDEREVYVIEAIPSEGRVETFYFETQTGLLLRQDVRYEEKGTIVNVKILFEDYVEFGGRRVATTFRQIAPQFTLSVKISDTTFDTPIDDAKFKMPSK